MVCLLCFLVDWIKDNVIVFFGGMFGVLIYALNTWHNWYVRNKLKQIEENTRMLRAVKGRRSR